MAGISDRALLLFILTAGGAWGSCFAADWPQWRGPTRDGVWSETGVVERFETREMPVKWRVAIGDGYNGPTVAGGRVFVMDRVTQPGQQERVHCFDAQTGDKLWSYAYECAYERVEYKVGPRASVTISDGRAYSLGTMGNLHCFDAKSGKVILEPRLQAGIPGEGSRVGHCRRAISRGRPCHCGGRRQGQRLPDGVRQSDRAGAMAGIE